MSCRPTCTWWRVHVLSNLDLDDWKTYQSVTPKLEYNCVFLNHRRPTYHLATRSCNVANTRRRYISPQTQFRFYREIARRWLNWSREDMLNLNRKTAVLHCMHVTLAGATYLIKPLSSLRLFERQVGAGLVGKEHGLH